MTQPINKTRRALLRAASCTAAAAGAQAFIPQMNLLGHALAQSGGLPGYKAIVCLYLSGGNDSFNLLIPTTPARHDEYITARGGLYTGTPTALAIPRPGGATPVGSLAAALNLDGTSPAGNSYGFNPSCTELRDLYNMGRLAVMANVGPLVEPITKSTFGSRARPPQIYSHNDQTELWNIGSGNTTSTRTGWAGQLAGRLGAGSQLSGLSPCISIAGQTRLLVGVDNSNRPINAFRMSSSSTTPASTLNNYGQFNTATGSFSFNAANFEQQRRDTYEALVADAMSAQGLFRQENAQIIDRSLDLANTINQQISQNGAIPAGITFPNTDIGNQLAQVFRMIRVSRPGGSINANRQVYYASTGGYDTHDGQIPNVQLNQGHQGLLQRVSQAVMAFYRALAAIGAHNDVLLFTFSEFGRTINSNGNGTDHGWGGVQFVVGGGQGNVSTGAVSIAGDTGGGPLIARNRSTASGTGIYGRYPRVVLNASDNAGIPEAEKGECFNRGQFLPTMATDQMCASMARWMGLDAANLPLVFPNIDNFQRFAGTPGNLMAHTGRTVPYLQGI